MDETQTAAQKVMNSPRSIADKTMLIQQLIAGTNPRLIEAELDNCTFFLGFEPASSELLLNILLPCGLRVFPRSSFLTDNAKIESLIDTTRKLKSIPNKTLKLIVHHKTPWIDCDYEIQWYSYFLDEVSLLFRESGGYKIVNRKELLDG
jgi:hypothetical protein